MTNAFFNAANNVLNGIILHYM